MYKYLILLLSTVLFLACTEDPMKPNIVLIMADDLGFETLNIYGGESYKTPALDQLAESGLVFNHCYSTPLCTPSRVKLMTGKYNFRNYIGFGILDSTETTFAHLLKAEGYRTAIAGKWQLYGNATQFKLAGQHGTLPTTAGFDEYLLWQVQDRGFRYKSPTLESNSGLKTYPDQYGPDLFQDFILNFMESNRDAPFFIYYPMVLTHDPFQVTPDSPGWSDFEPDSLFVNDTTYFADNLGYVDKIIANMVKKMEELQIDQNTLLLFIGDNGTDRKVRSRYRGETVRGRKGFPVEYGTHVPFIAYWKGTISPGVSSSLIDFTDFATTLASLAGSELKDGRHHDGFDFSKDLFGTGKSKRRWIYTSYAPKWGNFENNKWVQTTDMKLYQDGTVVNVQKDPHETKDLRAELSLTEIELVGSLQLVLDSLEAQSR